MTDFPGGTIAEGIQVGNPAFPSCSTGCIAQSRGTAVALSDDEILAAQFLNGSVGKQTAEKAIEEL